MFAASVLSGDALSTGLAAGGRDAQTPATAGDAAAGVGTAGVGTRIGAVRVRSVTVAADATPELTADAASFEPADAGKLVRKSEKLRRCGSGGGASRWFSK